MTPRVCGAFELIRKVGEGATSEVFLAHGPSEFGGGLAAVKVLRGSAAQEETFIDMFLDEARLAKRLDHPGICRVYDVGRSRGTFYLAMEWFDGVTLTALATGGPLPVPVVTAIGYRVAEALHYAHTVVDDGLSPLGVIHRDVSPDNVLVGLDGGVKLVDFGIAKADTQLHHTSPGVVKAKLGYLAPEQLEGKEAPSTDLFGLSATLLEMLSGEPLFVRGAPADTIHAIRRYQKPPLFEVPGLPAPVRALLEQCLARDPALRLESAADYAAALQPHVGEDARSAVAEVVAERFPSRRAEVPPSVPRRRSDPQTLARLSVDRGAAPPETPKYWWGVVGLVIVLAVALWFLR